MTGTVYLVGAGPGDPGLITVRGAEVLRAADLVVYDRLASPALLDLAPADADACTRARNRGGRRSHRRRSTGFWSSERSRASRSSG